MFATSPVPKSILRAAICTFAAMKVLVIQTAFIGDVVLALPVVQALHAQIPDAEVHILVRKGNEGLVQNRPDVAHVWIWDKQQGKIRNLFQLARAFRAQHFDYIFNLHRFASTGLLTAMSGARHTCGFDKNPLSWLFDKRIKHTFELNRLANAPYHEVERNLLLINDLVNNASKKPKFYLAEKDREKISQLCAETGANNWITIAPASVWLTKQFPAHKWVELIQALPADLHVFLLGGKGDSPLNEEIMAQCGRSNVHNVAGKLSFMESAALMEQAAAVCVNDSAPLHFASAVNARTVAVFCSTIPQFGFTPLADRQVVIEAPTPLPCRPCGLHGKKACPQGHFRCAEDIDSARVAAAIATLRTQG